MRNKLLIAAFLGTTALTPKSADAAPVVGFIAGSLGVSAATAASVGISAGFAAGATFGGTVFGGLLVKTVVAVGLSKISQSLRSSPSAQQFKPSARMANFAQPISYAETVYGRTRKGGHLGFTGFKNNRRYYVPIIAAHEIEGVVEHWLDERPVTLNGNTGQNNPNLDTYPMRQYGRLNVFTGAPGQTADAGLVATFPEITEAHDFAGLAGAAIWAKRPPQEEFSQVYPRARQWAWTPVIDGKKNVYDPRTGTFGYTNNAALVIADWIVNTLGADVDWDEVALEASASDQPTVNAEQGTQPKWTINGTISDDQEFEDQRAQLAGACDAFLYERPDGKVGFKVGRWIEPDVTLTPADFTGFEITSGQWGADAPTEVVVTYTEPENAWRETPSGTWVESTAGRRKRDEPQLFTVTNHNQAARMAKRLAKVKRPKYTLVGEIGLNGYELIGKRFFRVFHPEMQIDQYFEIGEMTRESLVKFTITANSVEPSDFDFDAATEEPARPKYTGVTNNDDIPDVTGLTAGTVGGGAVDFTYTDQDESLTQQVRYREVGETNWQVVDVPAGQSFVRATGLVDGATYEYQARNRTAALRSGDWTPDTAPTFVVVTNTTPPVAHTAFTATLNGSDVDLAFTAPNDPNYFATQVYRATDSTNFSNAALVHTEYGIPSNADAWTDVAPGSGDQSYWIIPVNSSQVPGPTTGPQTVTIP